MTPVLDRYQLWDIAGVDGLQVVKSLTKCDRVTTIAPFQSLETTINGDHCAILRLCEGNFRIGWQGDRAVLESALEPLIKNQRVWVQRFNWLGAITIPESVDIRLFAPSCCCYASSFGRLKVRSGCSSANRFYICLNLAASCPKSASL